VDSSEIALERSELLSMRPVAIDDATSEHPRLCASRPVDIGSARAARVAITKPRFLRGNKQSFRGRIAKQLEDPLCSHIDLGIDAEDLVLSARYKPGCRLPVGSVTGTWKRREELLDHWRRDPLGLFCMTLDLRRRTCRGDD
jgi:hypothetical protein